MVRKLLNILTGVSAVVFLITIFLMTRTATFFTPLWFIFIDISLIYYVMVSIPVLIFLVIILIAKDHSVEMFQSFTLPVTIVLGSSMFGYAILSNLNDGLYYVISIL